MDHGSNVSWEHFGFHTGRDRAGAPCYVFEDATDAFKRIELADPAAAPCLSVFRGRFDCCDAGHAPPGVFF